MGDPQYKLYHVMARGNDGRKVFLKDRDYEAFLEGVAAARKRYPFYLYAYVLMSNHFHLLLEVQHYSTARVLQSLLTGLSISNRPAPLVPFVNALIARPVPFVRTRSAARLFIGLSIWKSPAWPVPFVLTSSAGSPISRQVK